MDDYEYSICKHGIYPDECPMCDEERINGLGGQDELLERNKRD